MAYEPFLINPRLARRARKMVTKHRRRRKLHGAAAAAHARKHGGGRRRRKSSSAMPAWKKYYLQRKKRLGYGYWKPPKGRRKAYRPGGDKGGLRRGRHRVKGTLVINRPRHRRRHRLNPLVTLGANPRHRRRHRQNPALPSLSFAGIDFKKIIPLALTSAGAVMAPGLVVGLLNKWGPLSIDTPMKAYGVQAAVAVGGMMALNKWVGKEYGMIWIVTATAVVLNSLVQDYVFGMILGAVHRPAPAATGGLGYVYPTNPTVEIGAYPGDFVHGVGAYPNELQDVGYYPYDGGYPV